MENNYLLNGKVYTRETVTINGKTFKFKRDEFETELTKILCKVKPIQQKTLNPKV